MFDLESVIIKDFDNSTQIIIFELYTGIDACFGLKSERIFLN